MRKGTRWLLPILFLLLRVEIETQLPFALLLLLPSLDVCPSGSGTTEAQTLPLGEGTPAPRGAEPQDARGVCTKRGSCPRSVVATRCLGSPSVCPFYYFFNAHFC